MVVGAEATLNTLFHKFFAIELGRKFLLRCLTKATSQCFKPAGECLKADARIAISVRYFKWTDEMQNKFTHKPIKAPSKDIFHDGRFSDQIIDDVAVHDIDPARLGNNSVVNT